MTTFSQAEAAIRAYFNTEWNGLTQIAWPDLDFTPPDSETWVRFVCVGNDGFQASMGDPTANRFRHFGIVTIQIFQPFGQGSIDARAKADEVLSIFQGVSLNGIYFFNANARQIGQDGFGYYQINVLISFRYDDIT